MGLELGLGLGEGGELEAVEVEIGEGRLGGRGDEYAEVRGGGLGGEADPAAPAAPAALPAAACNPHRPSAQLREGACSTHAQPIHDSATAKAPVI